MSKNLKYGILYLVLILGAIVMFLPFFWMVVTSLKTAGNVGKIPPQWIPNPIKWDNYQIVWEKVNFARYTANSIFLVVIEIIGTLLSCAFVAFGLAMYDFKLKNTIYILMLATLMLPFQVKLIPTYFIWKEFGLLNTYFPLIIPHFLGAAFGIFLLHQFIKGLPKELYEAAVMDGYQPIGIFAKIYLPLCKPALAALMIFSFMGAWNDTLGPLIYLQNKNLFTLPLGLLYLKGDSEIDTSLLMAGSVIITIPVVLVYLSAQKHFVQGVAATGIKG